MRLIQAKVLSTAHLFGKTTKPLAMSGSLDDLDLPGAGSCGGGMDACSLISAVGIDAFDEGEQSPRSLVEHQRSTIAVLDTGRVNGDAQQETECVDEDVALATRDLLARIKALRIPRFLPAQAALALWLSMMAVVGLALRPSDGAFALMVAMSPGSILELGREIAGSKRSGDWIRPISKREHEEISVDELRYEDGHPLIE